MFKNAKTQHWDNLWAMEAGALRLVATSGKASLPKALNAPQPKPDKAYAVSGTVAIVPIVGPIGKYPVVDDDDCEYGISTIATQQAIQQALNDDTIDSITLYLDSPGGTVAGTSDLAAFIARNKVVKPITAFISDHCFSAAYWLASQCSSIVANEGAFIGSIGVYSVIMDTSKAAENAGVQVTLVSAGEYKGLEEPGLPIDQRAVAQTQLQVNACYDLFVKSISEGRNLPVATVYQLANGQVHIAQEAMTLQLIDAIGTLETAMSLKGKPNQMSEKKSSAQANVTATATPATDAPAPADALTLKTIMDAITALTAKVDAMVKAEADEDGSDGDSADEAPAGDPSQAKADDEEAKIAKAVASHKDRLVAIHEACAGRADFAIKAWTEGKTAIEAKAALADVLRDENTTLRKQVATGGEGMQPIAVGGSVETLNTNDPNYIWENNEEVRKAHSGKKEYFLARFKKNKNKA